MIRSIFEQPDLAGKVVVLLHEVRDQAQQPPSSAELLSSSSRSCS
jgi:hypothetical protein